MRTFCDAIFLWCWLHALLILLRGGQFISSELNGVTGFFPTFKRSACQNHLLVVSCRSAPFVFDGKGITSNLMTYLFILQDFISKLFWKFYWEKQNIHVLPSTAKLITVKVSYFEVWWVLHEDHSRFDWSISLHKDGLCSDIWYYMMYYMINNLHFISC